MKFIHCADIHLDSPLLGLERYEGAPIEEVRGATRRALENLVRLATDESVDFVVIAGDLFDGDWPDFNTGLFFVKQMAQLNEAGINVYVVRGNHDAESKITRDLPLPANVQVLPAGKPQTIRDDNLGIAVHGQSFARPSVTDDLAADYPQRIASYFNLGILHTALTGREGHASYAPCKVDTLVAKGYDYWALGHIHKREIVHRDPWIVFPGNTQGRTIRETGSKGCELVTVENGVIRAEHRALDVVRWELLEVDATAAVDVFDIHGRFRERLAVALESADGRTVAARVTIRGRCKAHGEIAAAPEAVRGQIRSLALDESNGRVWVEKILLASRPEFDMTGLLTRDDPIGELARLAHSLKEGAPGDLAALAAELADLKRKLPAELSEGADAIALEDPDFLRRVIEEVEQGLIPRLIEAEASE